MRRTLSRIGSVLALSACGRFASENGETPSPPPPAVEAGADASREDDASTAADSAPADAGKTFCATVTADFCEDWEADTGPLWDRGDSDATVQRDTNRPHTDSFSLDSQTPASSNARAVLSHAVETTKRKGRLSAWVWVEEWLGKDPVTFIELGIEPSDGKTARVAIQFTGDAADGSFNFKLLTQHDSSDSSSERVKVVPQTWIKLALDFDMDGSTVKLAEEVGPEPSSFTVNAVTFGKALPIDRYQLRLGLVVSSDVPTAHIYIDDVTLNLE